MNPKHAESGHFGPRTSGEENALAIEIMQKCTLRDTDKRTLPMTLPGAAVDADGRPLPEGDPRRKPQKFDSFYPIAVDDGVANELLKFNTVNRRQSRNNVRALTQVIMNGEWKFNGVSSTLPCSNTALQDKQHTLLSVVGAFAAGRSLGVPVKPIVLIPIIGLHPSVFDGIDCGKTRTTKDTLYVGARIGEVDLLEINESVWSHAIRLLAQYLNFVQDIAPSNPFYLENIRDRLPNNRVIELYKLSPHLQESISFCSRLGIPQSGALIPLAVIGVVHAIIAEVQSTNAANLFARGLATGANLETTSPIHHLREQVIRDKGSNRRTEGIELLAMCVRTWNNVAAHKDAVAKKRIRAFNSDGSFPLPIPTQRRSASVTR